MCVAVGRRLWLLLVTLECKWQQTGENTLYSVCIIIGSKTLHTLDTHTHTVDLMNEDSSYISYKYSFPIILYHIAGNFRVVKVSFQG